MIQSVLLFSLGFLSAAFIALMVAPAIWGRAVALTRKRIEASVPLTMHEIEANKDQLRAEFAVASRRLEMRVNALREKTSLQMAEISKAREDAVRLTGERDELRSVVAAIERRTDELATDTSRKREEFEELQAAQNEARKQLEKRNHELERLALRLQDSSEIADSRKIELIARETEISSIADKLSDYKREQKELRRYAREKELENKAVQEALRQELKRRADAEKKNERILVQLSDQEEKLERREKETVRLRDQLKAYTLEQREMVKKLSVTDSARLGLEAEIGKLRARLGTLAANAQSAGTEKPVSALEDVSQRQQPRVYVLAAEKKPAEEKPSQSHMVLAADREGELRDTAVLREQINDLAAEVVRMTATLEGPDSPIHAALKTKPKRAHNDDIGTADTRPISLVDRVKALQRAAAGDH